MPFSLGRKTLTIFASVIAIGFAVATVDAKPGKGASSGSRGARTDTSVPSTPTAPRATTGAPSNPAAVPGRPAAAAQAAKPSMMSTMAKGFAMGLIGAGLFGLLTGSGLFGNLSGIMGFLGLLLQVALIVLAARLIWGFFRNRQQANQPQMAAPAGYARTPTPEMAGGATNAAMAAPQPMAAQAVEPQRVDGVGIGPDDYTAFQGVLADLMGAYSNEDIAGIRRVTTPDVAAQFIRELHDNQQKGLVNRIGQPKLLQGDLAESWYEDSTAYATVAMRFAMTDVTMERATGKIVAGNANQPEESVEIWTFRREGAGRPWQLCGQQQA